MIGCDRAREVSETYIMGIKEGRHIFTKHPDMSLEEMKEIVQQCKLLARDHSQPLKDVFRGERDFWLNQMKKLKG